ncbi:hypothetical protein Tco_1449381, partial [Tanacetum coccineum]
CLDAKRSDVLKQNAVMSLDKTQDVLKQNTVMSLDKMQPNIEMGRVSPRQNARRSSTKQNAEAKRSFEASRKRQNVGPKRNGFNKTQHSETIRNKSKVSFSRKVLSEEEASCSDSNYKEYAMAVRDFKKFFRRRGMFLCQPHDDKKNFRKIKETKDENERCEVLQGGDPNHFKVKNDSKSGKKSVHHVIQALYGHLNNNEWTSQTNLTMSLMMSITFHRCLPPLKQATLSWRTLFTNKSHSTNSAEAPTKLASYSLLEMIDEYKSTTRLLDPKITLSDY